LKPNLNSKGGEPAWKLKLDKVGFSQWIIDWEIRPRKYYTQKQKAAAALAIIALLIAHACNGVIT